MASTTFVDAIEEPLKDPDGRVKLGDPRDCGSPVENRLYEDQRCEQCSIRSRSWNHKSA